MAANLWAADLIQMASHSFGMSSTNVYFILCNFSFSFEVVEILPLNEDCIPSVFQRKQRTASKILSHCCDCKSSWARLSTFISNVPEVDTAWTCLRTAPTAQKCPGLNPESVTNFLLVSGTARNIPSMKNEDEQSKSHSNLNQKRPQSDEN